MTRRAGNERRGTPATEDAPPSADGGASGTIRVRLDVWLDVSCLCKTRSEAQRACNGGKVSINGQHARPHREVKPGDRLVITRPLGRKQEVVVRGLADRHVAKAEARLLYEDVTPPPSPEEQAVLDLLRAARHTPAPSVPDRRDRRARRRLKGLD